MKFKAILTSLVVGVLTLLVPAPSIASTPQPPAGPVFNQVQLKVLVDNDFAVFMGNDQEITRTFYQNNVSWPEQIQNIQTLDVYPLAGETFIYILPMGGNGYIPPGGGEGGEEDFNGVLNNIPLLDYPGAEVAVGRSVVDARDVKNYGYLLFHNYFPDYIDRVNEVAGGTYTIDIADMQPASRNLIWSPATRNNHPEIPDPKPHCSVSCNGGSFNPAIPNGAWNFPDGSAVLFRYPLTNANLPVSPGDRSVTVSWKDPGAGTASVDSYLIEYKETSQPDSAYKVFGSVDGSVRSSTVTGLTNGTPYTLRVTAINQQGSASSTGRSVVPTGTPSRPANQSYAAGDGSVSINFSPPENDGGMAVTNYAYSIDDGATWITRNPASVASPITIPGLTNFQNYSVRLRAINPFGAGQQSLPIVVQSGIVSTRTLTYASGTLATVTNLPVGAVLNEGDAFTVPAGPSRTNFTFTGWKDGNTPYAPGDTYTIGAGNPTLTAQWVPNSLLGVTPGSRSKVLTWNIVSGQSIDVTVAAGSENSVRIQIPADALEAGTEVIFWRLLNDDLAKQRINSEKDYFVNLALTWSIGDDLNTPMEVKDATSPILMTINNPSIVEGATAWQIVGERVRVVGTAAQAGSLVLSFTEDPVITAANVPPLPEFSTPVPTADGFEVSITNYDSNYGWENPTVSVGSVTITGTVGSVRTLLVTGLTEGQSATVTQRASLNGIFQSAAVTGRTIVANSSPAPEPATSPDPVAVPVIYGGPVPAQFSAECVAPGVISSVNLSGTRLETISSVEVDGKAGKVLAASGELVELELPALESGIYSVIYSSSFGKLTHVNALKVCESSQVTQVRAEGSVATKLVKKRFASYLGDSQNLSQRDSKLIADFLKANLNLSRVTCIGSTSGRELATDPRLALGRARSACDLVSRLAPEIEIKVLARPAQGTGQFFRAVSIFGLAVESQ